MDQEISKVDVKATAKTVRITPRKVRLVLDLVRGKDVEHALGILAHTPNFGAEVVANVVKSAVANAVNNHQLSAENLYIKECYANDGMTIKRFRPRAKGAAAPIMKRTSHITVVVEER